VGGSFLLGWGLLLERESASKWISRTAEAFIPKGVDPWDSEDVSRIRSASLRFPPPRPILSSGEARPVQRISDLHPRPNQAWKVVSLMAAREGVTSGRSRDIASPAPRAPCGESLGAARDVGGQRTIRPTRSTVASCVQRKPSAVLNGVHFFLTRAPFSSIFERGSK